MKLFSYEEMKNCEDIHVLKCQIIALLDLKSSECEDLENVDYLTKQRSEIFNMTCIKCVKDRYNFLSDLHIIYCENFNRAVILSYDLLMICKDVDYVKAQIHYHIHNELSKIEKLTAIEKLTEIDIDKLTALDIEIEECSKISDFAEILHKLIYEYNFTVFNRCEILSEEELRVYEDIEIEIEDMKIEELKSTAMSANKTLTYTEAMSCKELNLLKHKAIQLVLLNQYDNFQYIEDMKLSKIDDNTNDNLQLSNDLIAKIALIDDLKELKILLSVLMRDEELLFYDNCEAIIELKYLKYADE